ncbi:hypothetical protein HMPREF1548_02609 [Clostridium sp. KLE 1755]|nr:hypothetical protein HMPREF1548_02609 [Clostridium sp. KLE 1755]
MTSLLINSSAPFNSRRRRKQSARPGELFILLHLSYYVCRSNYSIAGNLWMSMLFCNKKTGRLQKRQLPGKCFSM